MSITIVLIIALSSIIIFNVLSDVDQEGTNDPDGDPLYIIASGNEKIIFTNSTTSFSNITSSVNITSKLIPDTSFSTDLINNSILYFIGSSYNRSLDDGCEIYRDNSSDKKLTVKPDGSISFYYSSYDGQIIKSDSLIDNTTLINRTDKLLKDLGYNLSGFKLNTVINTKITRRNSKDGTSTLTGYDNQCVIYDQYINNMKVTGQRGTIEIYYGKGGTIYIFQDRSIKVNEIISTGQKMIDINSSLNIVSNFTLDTDETDLFLRTVDIVYYCPYIELNSNIVISTHYEFVFNPIGRDDEIKYYLYTNEII